MVHTLYDYPGEDHVCQSWYTKLYNARYPSLLINKLIKRFINLFYLDPNRFEIDIPDDTSSLRLNIAYSDEETQASTTAQADAHYHPDNRWERDWEKEWEGNGLNEMLELLRNLLSAPVGHEQQCLNKILSTGTFR